MRQVRMRRFVARAALGLSCAALPFSVSPRLARADASLADKAAAQTLFDEGRKLMAKGMFADACPKLAESQKLDPGVGTQFNLSDCYEKMGQTASAWAGFLEAASARKSRVNVQRRSHRAFRRSPSRRRRRRWPVSRSSATARLSAARSGARQFRSIPGLM
jgi:tetratricopeptide (TPR) repeat protein